MSKIADSILQAIDTVVSQRLTQLQFDNTVVCKVIDNSKKEQGEYTVEFQGKTKFYAYSDFKEYSINTNVYVLIPNGDWSAKKSIVGRQDATNIQSVVSYIHPMDTIAIYGTERYGDTAVVSAEVTAKPADQPYQYSLEIPYTYEVAGSTVEDYVYLTSANVLGNPCDIPVPQKIHARIQAPANSSIVVSSPERWTSLVDEGFEDLVSWSEQTTNYGLDLNSRDNETVELATVDKLEIPQNTPIFRANLKCLWINKNTNNTYLGFEPGHLRDRENAQIILASKRKDEQALYYWISWFYQPYGSTDWQEITPKNEDGTYKWTEELVWETVDIKPQMSFQVRIYRNGREIISKPITYVTEEHQKVISNPPLTLSIEGETDYFNIYDINGSTTEVGPYQFKVKYGGWPEEKIKDAGLYNKTVLWSIKSTENSMIKSIDDHGYVKLHPQYRATTDVSNTIVAQVFVDGQSYTAEKVLRFNTIDMSGNGYYIYISRPNKIYDFKFDMDPKISSINYAVYKDDEQILSLTKVELYPPEYASLRKVISAEVNKRVVARKTVPLAIGVDGYRYEGPTSVVYDAFGKIIRGHNIAMKLYYNDKIVENAVFLLKNAGSDWSIIESENKIKAPDMYMENENICISVYVDGVEVWRQGLVVFQTKYSSQFINDWDGSLVLNEEEGTMMSAMVGAGKKNSEGAFTGVFIGDITSLDTKNPTTTGLFGYTEGVQSFGFYTNGKAFLGGSGRGQILFDGKQGYIESREFIPGESGLRIDLAEGIIEAAGTIKIGKAGQQLKYENGQLTIEGNITANSLSTDYFAAPYSDGTKSVVRLGQIGSAFHVDHHAIYYGTFKAPKPADVFICSDGTADKYTIGNVAKPTAGWCLGIGTNFGVLNDGTLHAKNANITGEINASSGIIGKWKIEKSEVLTASVSKEEKSCTITLDPHVSIPYTGSQNGTYEGPAICLIEAPARGGAAGGKTYYAYMTPQGIIRGVQIDANAYTLTLYTWDQIM